jgi:hypothetical protein
MSDSYVDFSQLEDFGTAIGDWASARKVGIQKAMKYQMGLLAKQLMDFTPPDTLNQGRARVLDDVWYSVGYLPWFLSGGPTNKRRPSLGATDLRKLIRSRSKNREKNLTAYFSNFQSGALKGAVAGPLDKKLHSDNRNNRGGVKRRDKFKFVTADHAAVRAYVIKKQKNVGMAKGGWAEALQKFERNPPGWISKHAGHGSADDRSSDPKDPYIRMTNRSPWTERGAPRSALDRMKTAISRRVPHIYTHIEEQAKRDILRKLSTLKTRGAS